MGGKHGELGLTGDLLGTMTGPSSLDDEAAARANAWAERMKAKRQAAKARIAADQRAASGEPEAPGPTYWTTDALFSDSRRAEEADLARRPDPATVSELLGVLDLRDDADADALSSAYRRLAKVHHPDRFAMADEETQRLHAERMLAINRAYQHLRSVLRD